MASSKPTCVITSRVSAPCEQCGQRTEPSAHMFLSSEDVEDDNAPDILCARCCPVHGIASVTQEGA